MNYQTKELLAMKLEFESYQGNKALEQVYLNLSNSLAENPPWLEEDLRRVQQNIQFIESQLAKLPEKERTFLSDVYLKNNTKKEIQEKYGLSSSSYHRKLDKAIYAFIRVKEND